MKKYINKGTYGFLACLITSTATYARPLAEELSVVMEKSPSIKAGKFAVEAAQERSQAAQSGFLPKYTFMADTGYESISTTSFKPDQNMVLGNDGVVTPSSTSELNRRKLGFVLEQSIFNGGRVQAGSNIADTELRMQELNLKASAQDILLEAITNYLQVGRYQTLIGLANLNEKTTQSQLEFESKRVKAGGGVEIDVMQARTRLQIVKERRVFYEQGLRDALASYEQTFGHEPNLSKLEDLGIFQNGLPTSLKLATDMGLADHPRIKISNLQVSKAQEQIKLAKSLTYPTVDGVLSANADVNANATARRNDYALLLKLNWNFSLGMEAQHRVAAAMKDEDELTEKALSSRNRTREAIRIAWNLVVNGKERIELLDSAAMIAKDVMLSRKKLRDAGKESALSALDAEVEYYGVLANKINAMYDTRIGSYRLLAAIGALTPESIGSGQSLKLPIQPLQVNLESIARNGVR